MLASSCMNKLISIKSGSCSAITKKYFESMSNNNLKLVYNHRDQVCSFRITFVCNLGFFVSLTVICILIMIY